MKNKEAHDKRKLYWNFFFSKKEIFLKILFLKFFFKVLKAYGRILIELISVQFKNQEEGEIFEEYKRKFLIKRNFFAKKLIPLKITPKRGISLENLQVKWKRTESFKKFLGSFFFLPFHRPIGCKFLGKKKNLVPLKKHFLNPKKFKKEEKWILHKPFPGFFFYNPKKVIRFKKFQNSKNKSGSLEVERQLRTKKGFFNFNVLLKIFNNLIFFHQLRGFTRKALEMIVYNSNQ